MPIWDPWFKPNIAQLAERKDVKGLLRVLQSSQPAALRGAAALALGRLAELATAPALLDYLGDPDSEHLPPAQRADFQPESAAAREKLARLKERIRASGRPVVENYGRSAGLLARSGRRDPGGGILADEAGRPLEVKRNTALCAAGPYPLVVEFLGRQVPYTVEIKAGQTSCLNLRTHAQTR